jgi:hypothetical protein
VLSLILGTTIAETATAEVVDLPLKDQYGVEDSLAAHRGQVTVVIVVTAKRLRNIRPWEEALRERFDTITFLRITDVPEDSSATFDQVAAKLEERVPEGVSVLIDMDRVWADALALDTGRPNVLIFDADGHLVTSQRGKYSPELVSEIISALETLVTAR